MDAKRFPVLSAVALALGLSLTLALVLLTGRDAQAESRVLYVDRGAPGPVHDGLSWTTAFTELQTALAVSLSGDEIWVAESVYYPDYDPNTQRYTGYVTATFHLKPDVAIYGGFAGTETAREQRAWVVNVTTLSGDLDRNDMLGDHSAVAAAQQITGTNAWTVVSAYGAEGAVLDGFTISGGNANGGGEWWEPAVAGGGVYVDGIPMLNNLIVSGNSADSGGGM